MPPTAICGQFPIVRFKRAAFHQLQAVSSVGSTVNSKADQMKKMADDFLKAPYGTSVCRCRKRPSREISCLRLST